MYADKAIICLDLNAIKFTKYSPCPKVLYCVCVLMKALQNYNLFCGKVGYYPQKLGVRRKGPDMVYNFFLEGGRGYLHQLSEQPQKNVSLN